MTKSKVQKSKQISKTRKKKKKKKVIKGLKKASKTHASQAKTLQGVIGGRSKKGNGKKA